MTKKKKKETAIAKANGSDIAPMNAIIEATKDLPDLSVEQMVFCVRYAIHGNGAQAVREAKIPIANERMYAWELLTKTDIQAHIKAIRAKMGELHFDLANQMINRYRRMAEADITELYDADGNLKDPKDWPDDCKMLVCGIEVEEHMTGQGDAAMLVRTKKLKLESRKAVQDSIMKVLGQFTDKDDRGVTLIQPIINMTCDGKPIKTYEHESR